MPLKPSKKWKTPFEVMDRTLVLRFSKPQKVISSAVRGGGIGWAHAIINHQVPDNHCPLDSIKGSSRRQEDPSRTLKKVADSVGVMGRTVALMTAVDLRQLIVRREQAQGLWVEGFFTVGVTNAVRAGESSHHDSDIADVGTINMILVTNARLSVGAMVGAVGVATESKTAVLLEEKVKSCHSPHAATGTGTDVVAIATGDGPSCRYSGTHTKIGELIGRVVHFGIKKGLHRDRVWRRTS